MWKLDNPGVIVLLSVLSGCVILYTTSGVIIGTVLLLIVLVYACVSLLIDESLVTRHASIINDYLSQASVDFWKLVEIIGLQTSGYVYQLFQVIKKLYKEQITNRMERYRRSTYQLSSDSLVKNSRASGEIRGLSPIAKRIINARISESENNVYGRGARDFDKVTSTPMTSWKHRETPNGDISGDSLMTHRRQTKSSYDVLYNLDGSKNEETFYGAQEGSPWGTSISPKIRSRAGGVKTVQTVAGPLLASTRYNIDAKTYSDVTSPGLTTRLTKYATEATTKLMHQSQYGTGQFPKVNLNSSPTPLINSKTGKMRLPVTVRVAPPDTRYSPPDRQRIMSDICQKEAQKTPPTVAQVLRDMSLKRHASREDVAAELIKKQRTDGLYGDDLENLEEMTREKRARDESSRSDEDISIDNTSLRPLKRTKKPSCYDIINSLSSSTNVNSGVKRKADISRSGTPDIGKHFKSLDTNQASGSPKTSPDVQRINKSSSESDSSMTSLHSPRKSPKSPTIKQTSPQDVHKIEEIFKDSKNSMMDVPVKLTDRLFMREEPQNIEKLKTLIDEHSSLSSKFSKSDVEEIKKSDIVNMRQTSMKAKLKSMFDAISGKTSSTIDPSVVIQAEETAPSPASPSSLATLSSTTSTTNVNTSPISTSAIVPIIGKTKSLGTPGKHVTFSLPSASTASTGSMVSSSAGAEGIKKSESSTVPSFSFGSNPVVSSGDKPQSGFSMPSTTPASTPSLFSAPQSTPASVSAVVSSASSTPVSAASNPQFSFGTSTSSTSQTVPTFSQSTQKLSFQPASTASSGLFSTSPKPTTLFNTSTSITPVTSAPVQFPSSTKSPDPPKLTGFNFGGATTSASSTPAVITTSSPATSTGFTFGGANPPVFGANSTTAPSTQPNFTFGGNKTTPATTQSSGFSFGSNSTPVMSFGASTSQPAASTGTITFGTAASTPSFGTPSTKAPPAFGTPSATASAPAFGTPSTTAPPAYGTPSTTAQITFGASSTAPPAYGTPSTAPPAYGASTAPPAYGTPSTTAQITFGTSSTAFGTPSSTASLPAFGTPATTAPPAFGASSSTPAFGSQSTTPFGTTPTPLFGTSTQSTAFNPTPTTASITFGTPKTTTAFGTTTASNTSLFNGGTSAGTPAATSAPSSMFSGGSSFGQAKSPAAFGATTTASGFGNSSFGSSSLFGGQPTTTGFGSSSTTTSTFAAGTSTTGFGGGTPAFGSSTTTAPAFGATGTTPVPSFGASSSGFGAQNGSSSGFSGANSGFGATTTAPPAFPTGTPSTSAFGTSTSSSFGTTSTAPPAFGSASSSFSGFGGNGAASGASSPFGGTAPAFAGSSSTAPAFGAANGTAGGGFAFGGTPATATTTPATQQNSMFSFGGSSSSSNAGFQFSSAAAPQPGGFNFSGSAAPGAASVPSFSAPAPSFGSSSGGNMFSIGSGSVAPRSRSTRQGRRQR